MSARHVKLFAALSVLILSQFSQTTVVLAQEAPAQTDAAAVTPPASGADTGEAESESESAAPTPAKGGPKYREKDIEGTQAPNRFEADPIIKSKYQLNGESLEVDPD